MPFLQIGLRVILKAIQAEMFPQEMQGNLQRFVRFHFKQGLKRSLEVYKEQGSPIILPIL